MKERQRQLDVEYECGIDRDTNGQIDSRFKGPLHAAAREYFAKSREKVVRAYRRLACRD